MKKKKRGSRYTPRVRRCFICLEEMNEPEAPPAGFEISGWAHRGCCEELAETMRGECDICQADDPHQHLSVFG